MGIFIPIFFHFPTTKSTRNLQKWTQHPRLPIMLTFYNFQIFGKFWSQFSSTFPPLNLPETFTNELSILHYSIYQLLKIFKIFGKFSIFSPLSHPKPRKIKSAKSKKWKVLQNFFPKASHGDAKIWKSQSTLDHKARPRLTSRTKNFRPHTSPVFVRGPGTSRSLEAFPHLGRLWSPTDPLSRHRMTSASPPSCAPVIHDAGLAVSEYDVPPLPS